MSKVTYNTYPRYVDIERDGVSQKVFTTPTGNEEWCTPTGRELQKGQRRRSSLRSIIIRR